MSPHITIEFSEHDLKKLLTEHVEKEYFSSGDLKVDEVTMLDRGGIVVVVKLRKNFSAW